MHHSISQVTHQLDATLYRFYFCRVTLHVSGASAHHQEYLKLVRRPEIKPAQCCIKLVFHLTYRSSFLRGRSVLKMYTCIFARVVFWSLGLVDAEVVMHNLAMPYSEHTKFSLQGLNIWCCLVDYRSLFCDSYDMQFWSRTKLFNGKGKGKGKFHPRTDHEAPKGE